MTKINFGEYCERCYYYENCKGGIVMSDVLIEISEAIAEVLSSYSTILKIKDSDEAFDIAQEMVEKIPEIKEDINNE